MQNADEIAHRDSWKNLPLPAQRARLPVERTFTGRDYNRLAHGLIPGSMDDKWFIFMENETLFFQRSWTGVCIYQVQLDGQHRIEDAWVNRDTEQYKETNIEYDSKLLYFLIDNLLLGHNMPFPVSPNIPSGLPDGVYQHHVSGTAYPQKQPRATEGWKAKIRRFFGKET